MYLACSPGNIGFSLSFKECAETAARLGYEGYWFNLGKDAELSAAETRDLLAKYHLRPAGGGLPLNFRAAEADFQEALKKAEPLARFAREIGVERTMTWLAPGSDDLDYKAHFEQYRSRLKAGAAMLGNYGITLGLEFVGTPSFRKNNRYEFIHNVDGTLELIAAIGEPNVGLVMDVWHWEMAGHTLADFKKLKSEKQIVAVHLNDAPEGLSREEQIDTVRCLPGATGVLPVGQFLEGIASLRYQGPAVVEPFYPALAAMPFPEAAEMVYRAARKVWKQ